MRTTHHYDTEAEWLAMRTQDVTSTVTAALFGLSPYTTMFEVWHSYASGVPLAFTETKRMRWGRRLEDAIATGIGDEYGVTVEPFKVYIRDPDVRIGSSFDYQVTGLVEGWRGEDSELRRMFAKHGPGILEIKNTAMDWIDGEAPDHIEIQAQHQLEVAELPWACIGALVRGNDEVLLFRQREHDVGKAIIEQVQAFWQSIADGNAPAPVFPDDAQAVIRRCQFADPGKVIDLRGNSQAAELVNQYRAAGDAEKAIKATKETSKAQLLQLMGDAEKATLDGFTISAGLIGPCEVAYTREGYRSFRVTAKKESRK